MAARNVVRTSFVDLSLSDDDNVFPSNHGLLLPGTFESTQNLLSKKTHDSHRSAPQAHTLGSGRNNTQSSIRPKANINRRITEQSLPATTIIKAADSLSFEQPPAKRRKTDGGTGVSQGTFTSVPARALSSKRQSLNNTQVAESPRSSKYAPILPPVKGTLRDFEHSHVNRSNDHSQNLARVSGASSLNERSENVQHHVSKADRLRADKVRGPLNSVVHNRQSARHSAAEVLEPHHQVVKSIIRKQVMIHVKSTLNRYSTFIGENDLTKLGRRIIEELVDDDKFQHHLERLLKDPSFSNQLDVKDRRLPVEYELELSVKAGALAHEYASDFVPRLRSKPVELLEQPALDTPTSRSGSDDEVFVTSREQLEPHTRPLSRHLSSSPATSFSIDVNEGTSPTERELAGVCVNTTPSNPSAIRIDEKHSHLTGINNPKSSQDKHVPRQHSKSKRPSRQEVNPANSKIMHDSRPRLTIDCIRYLKQGILRPYLGSQDREDIQLGLEIAGKYELLLSASERESLSQLIYHVDFDLEEAEGICKLIQRFREDKVSSSNNVRIRIIHLMRGQARLIPRLIGTIRAGHPLLQTRSAASIKAFLHDAVEGKNSTMPRFTHINSSRHPRKFPQKPPISSLLNQREVHGMRPVRVCHGQQPLKVEISSHFEDELVSTSEWTDFCGDVSTLSWTGEETFVCGATSHSDYHNMQYNKPGNLAVGCTSSSTVRAVADHRIPRPLINCADNSENSLESMRQTQDPWLYTSVVSSSHCEINGLTFTASFDHTVKVWHISQEGSSMDLRGTWNHDGKVNFVVTSRNHEGVATACDVSSDAIRVYKIDGNAISQTSYVTYCGEKAREQAQELGGKDSWAYFPAAIQWGKALGVAEFLLVGYSPRSMTGQDVDIPEEKKNTGELCLWNTHTGERITISSTRTQNVFEVLWHPSHPLFLAATSPSGEFGRDIRTQVRLFAQNETGMFFHVKALDCPAFDINELTIMPNSWSECYVTASCTDGVTYVWDTAQGDRPIHALSHGDSIDELVHDLPREIADTGVKFASWGKSADRFYTGSSDGKVKCWDIRRPNGHAFVRTVLSVSGVITAGAFSTTFRKLLIGDATGKVHLLEIDDSDEHLEDDIDITNSEHLVKPLSRNSAILVNKPKFFVHNPEGPGSGVIAKKPKVIIHHPEPPAPHSFQLNIEEGKHMAANVMAHEGWLAAQEFLNEGYLTLHPDPAIGVVQGPNYAETRLFLKAAHQEDDPSSPLLPEWEARQQYMSRAQKQRPRLPVLPKVTSSDRATHQRNINRDLDLSRLPLSTQAELLRDGVDLNFEPAQDFSFELSPRSRVFRKSERRRRRKVAPHK